MSGKGMKKQFQIRQRREWEHTATVHGRLDLRWYNMMYPLILLQTHLTPPPPFGYIIRVDKWKSFFASQTKFKSKKCKNRFDEQTNCWNVKTTSSQHSFKNISKHFYCAQDSENLSYSFLFACNLNIILLTATCVVSVKNAVIMSFKSKILFACAPCVH